MYRFDAELWAYQGDGPWHFVTLPEELGDEIRARGAGGERAFGGVPVDVEIGTTRWSTSLFPDSKTQSYVLPVKKSIRASEGIVAGDSVDVRIELLN